MNMTRTSILTVIKRKTVIQIMPNYTALTKHQIANANLKWLKGRIPYSPQQLRY